jgi:hypothetical protein
MMVELVNEGFLKKEGRSYALNVEEEELAKWKDEP